MRRIFVTLIFLASTYLSSAVELIVPNALVEGATNTYPFWFTPCHYQQSYGASHFSLLGTNGGFITSVAFRGGGNTTSFVYAMTLSLSTTPVPTNTASSNLLHASFAENVGPDNTVVFSSNWRMRVFAPRDSPLQFQFVIPFSRPFFYNPTNGNLLLDIVITNDVTAQTSLQPAGLNYVGGSPDPLMCRVFGSGSQFSSLSTNGAVFPATGLVTEFGVRPVRGPSFRIGKFTMTGTNVICGSTNGAAGVIYTLLTSANPATGNWVPVGSNVFDANGSFLFTNRVATHSYQEFYILNLASP